MSLDDDVMILSRVRYHCQGCDARHQRRPRTKRKRLIVVRYRPRRFDRHRVTAFDATRSRHVNFRVIRQFDQRFQRDAVLRLFRFDGEHETSHRRAAVWRIALHFGGFRRVACRETDVTRETRHHGRDLLVAERSKTVKLREHVFREKILGVHWLVDMCQRVRNGRVRRQKRLTFRPHGKTDFARLGSGLQLRQLECVLVREAKTIRADRAEHDHVVRGEVSYGSDPAN